MKKKVLAALIPMLFLGLGSCSSVSNSGSSGKSSSRTTSLPSSSSSSSLTESIPSTASSDSSVSSVGASSSVSTESPLFTIAFDSNGGLFPDKSTIQNQQKHSGETVSPIDDPLREGFALEGWARETAGTVKVTFPAVVNESTTYYAMWRDLSKPLDPVTMYFVDQPWWNVNAAATKVLYWASSDPEHINGAAMMNYVGAQIDKDNNFFNYWSFVFDKGTYDSFLFTRTSGAGDMDWGAQTSDLLFSQSSGKNLYVLGATAVWKKDGQNAAGTWSNYDSTVLSLKVDVTFDFGYEEVAGTEKTIVVDIGKGNKAKALEASRTGFSFSGWFTTKDGGTIFDFSSLIDSNITLFAHWTPGHDNGGAPVQFCIIGKGSFTSEAWSYAKGLQMYANADAGSTDKAIYLNVSFAVGDVWDITDKSIWYHFDAVDPLSVKDCFEPQGENKDIGVIKAGVYDVYLNAAGMIYIGLSKA